MKSDFLIAVTQLAAERNLPREIVYAAIEAALISAYKKDNLAAGQDISVKLSPSDGEIRVYTRKTVVEKVEDELTELSVKEARRHQADAKLDDVIELETDDYNAGRIAAQTAKQVVMQRLREAERELVYEEYIEREGDILNATVQRVEPKQVILDLGRAEAILPASEEVPSERYRPNQRLKVYLLGVERTARGPEVIVSRAHRNLLKRLFELEVPEIYNGSVEIMAIAREAGSRSKVAVAARQEGVDPVGSCVGLRGIRIQNIVNELQGEKIDVVQWHNDPPMFISNALSPAQILRVDTNEGTNTATVVVSDRYLSLAIGREGQNARLAAKLTGWKVDIKSSLEYEAERAQIIISSEQLLTDDDTDGVNIASAEVADTGVSDSHTVEQEDIEIVVGADVAEIDAAVSGEKEVVVSDGDGNTQDTKSPEEMLLEEASHEEQDIPQEEHETLDSDESSELDGEDLWVLPEVQQERSGIRFSEDILGLRGGGSGTARRGGARRRGGGGSQQTPNSARKGKGKGKQPELLGSERPLVGDR